MTERLVASVNVMLISARPSIDWHTFNDCKMRHRRCHTPLTFFAVRIRQMARITDMPCAHRTKALRQDEDEIWCNGISETRRVTECGPLGGGQTRGLISGFSQIDSGGSNSGTIRCHLEARESDLCRHRSACVLHLRDDCNTRHRSSK